jgi:hypothetical protein
MSGSSQHPPTMPDAPPKLAEALSGRYTIERELGAGGMATVYLAQDVKHRRKVAVRMEGRLAALTGHRGRHPRLRAVPLVPHRSGFRRAG